MFSQWNVEKNNFWNLMSWKWVYTSTSPSIRLLIIIKKGYLHKKSVEMTSCEKRRSSSNHCHENVHIIYFVNIILHWALTISTSQGVFHPICMKIVETRGLNFHNWWFGFQKMWCGSRMTYVFCLSISAACCNEYHWMR